MHPILYLSENVPPITADTRIRDLPYDTQTLVFHQIELALYNLDSYDMRACHRAMRGTLRDLHEIMDTVTVHGVVIPLT